MPGETGSLILSKDCKLGQKEREAIFIGETIKMGELTGLSREGKKKEKRVDFHTTHWEREEAYVFKIFPHKLFDTLAKFIKFIKLQIV